MNQKKLWIIPVALAVVGLILFLLWWLLGSKESQNKTMETTPKAGESTGADPVVLQYGDRGRDVKILQSWINLKTPHREGASLLAMDGIFGSKTQAALYALSKTQEVKASLLAQAKKDMGLS